MLRVRPCNLVFAVHLRKAQNEVKWPVVQVCQVHQYVVRPHPWYWHRANFTHWQACPGTKTWSILNPLHPPC